MSQNPGPEDVPDPDWGSWLVDDSLTDALADIVEPVEGVDPQATLINPQSERNQPFEELQWTSNMDFELGMDHIAMQEPDPFRTDERSDLTEDPYSFSAINRNQSFNDPFAQNHHEESSWFDPWKTPSPHQQVMTRFFEPSMIQSPHKQIAMSAYNPTDLPLTITSSAAGMSQHQPNEQRQCDPAVGKNHYTLIMPKPHPVGEVQTENLGTVTAPAGSIVAFQSHTQQLLPKRRRIDTARPVVGAAGPTKSQEIDPTPSNQSLQGPAPLGVPKEFCFSFQVPGTTSQTKEERTRAKKSCLRCFVYKTKVFRYLEQWYVFSLINSSARDLSHVQNASDSLRIFLTRKPAPSYLGPRVLTPI